MATQMDEMEQLFYTYGKVLTIFSASILRDYQDAQDVVQEVFLECLDKNGGIDRPYLFKSVRNRSLNRIRAKNRLLSFVSRWQDYWNLLFMDVGENENNVWELLSVLPASQKEVLFLRIKGELKISQIAEILNIPEGTVKSRINSALSILRKKHCVS